LLNSAERVLLAWRPVADAVLDPGN
jgi:hypothetical protein